jgi:hypothetical protein
MIIIKFQDYKIRTHDKYDLILYQKYYFFAKIYINNTINIIIYTKI